MSLQVVVQSPELTRMGPEQVFLSVSDLLRDILQESYHTHACCFGVESRRTSK